MYGSSPRTGLDPSKEALADTNNRSEGVDSPLFAAFQEIMCAPFECDLKLQERPQLERIFLTVEKEFYRRSLGKSDVNEVDRR